MTTDDIDTVVRETLEALETIDRNLTEYPSDLHSSVLDSCHENVTEELGLSVEEAEALPEFWTRYLATVRFELEADGRDHLGVPRP